MMAPCCRFPTPPSASKAGQTLQESVHKRRVEPDRLPKDAPNVLIVLIDDAGFGVPDTFGGFAHTPTLSQASRRRHQLQPLSHHLDLLAHARGVADRAQSPARRQRHHRRACGGLGRLHRRHSEDFRDDGRGLEELRLQDVRLRQVAQHARRPDHRDGAVHLLAHELRLRVLLRLPRRRNLAVGAAPRGKHHRHRAAAR